VSEHTGLELFDGKFSRLAMTTNGFVDTSIGSTTDESDDFVTINYPNLTLISNGSWSSVDWIYDNISKVQVRARTTNYMNKYAS